MDISALESIVIQRHVLLHAGRRREATTRRDPGRNQWGGRDLAHRSRSSPEEDDMADRLTALIVAASRGLGLALTEAWLKRDARVIAPVRSDSKS